MHIHFHHSHDYEHNHPHDKPFSRVTRDLDTVLEWLTGTGMTEQQRSVRSQAEALNEKYGSGVL